MRLVLAGPTLTSNSLHLIVCHTIVIVPLVSDVLHEAMQNLHAPQIEPQRRHAVAGAERRIRLRAQTVDVREHGANARRSTVAEEGFDLCDRAIDRRTGTLRRVREQLDHRRQDVAERGFAERARRGRIAALERGPGRVAIDARRSEVRPRARPPHRYAAARSGPARSPPT